MKIIKRLGRLFIYGLLLGALTLSYSYYDVLLSQLSFNLVLREPLRQSKALVVMLGGHRLDRILKGSEVYHRGFAPKVYIGSGYLKRNSTPWWNPMFEPSGQEPWIPAGRWYYRELLRKGIPPRHIEIVPTPRIFDSAGELQQYLEHFAKRDIDSAIFVTSATHSKRLKMILRRLAPNFDSIVIGAENPKLREWWTDQNVRRQVFHEYGAMMKELCRNLAGSFA